MFKNVQFLALLVVLVCLGGSPTHPLAGETDSSQFVIYPGYTRDSYTVRLLAHALSYSKDIPYQTKALGADIPKERAIDLLGQRNGLDVLAGTCLKERTEQALPVHFPIFKGLNGTRIALIHRQNPHRLQGITQLHHLKPLLVGQFHTWSDTSVLRANGVNVYAGGDYEGLYQMLDRKRFDYFLRSVLEIEQDFNQHQYLQLMIDPHLVFQYPSAYYYFVSKDNPALARIILTGLEMALADGSFDKMFDEEFGARLRRLNIHGRQRLKLDNPLLCDDVPLNRSQLWFNPATAG